MKTKFNTNEENFKILQRRLDDVQQLSKDINNLKIELSNEINKIEVKRVRYTTKLLDRDIKQEGDKEGIKATDVNCVEGNIINYERKIKNLYIKSRESKSESQLESKQESKKGKQKIKLKERPTNKFKKGNKARVKNHYKGKYGDLFGKIGTVEEVGKSFIFLNFPGIPVLQQRSEINLELVE